MQGKVGNNELELSSYAKEKNGPFVTHSGTEVRIELSFCKEE